MRKQLRSYNRNEIVFKRNYIRLSVKNISNCLGVEEALASNIINRSGGEDGLTNLLHRPNRRRRFDERIYIYKWDKIPF
jgi:hypothetical protein